VGEVSSLRTDREIEVGFDTVVSGELAVTVVGGEFCVAYVDVVTDTPQDVSTIASKPASAAAHNRIAANPPLNAADIGCLLTEARSHLSSLAQNLATLLALGQMTQSANWQQIETLGPHVKRSAIRSARCRIRE